LISLNKNIKNSPLSLKKWHKPKKPLQGQKIHQITPCKGGNTVGWQFSTSRFRWIFTGENVDFFKFVEKKDCRCKKQFILYVSLQLFLLVPLYRKLPIKMIRQQNETAKKRSFISQIMAISQKQWILSFSWPLQFK
jgi:hypothetical protein